MENEISHNAKPFVTGKVVRDFIFLCVSVYSFSVILQSMVDQTAELWKHTWTNQSKSRATVITGQ